MDEFIKYYNMHSGKHNQKIELYFRLLVSLPENEQNQILAIMKNLCDLVPSMGKISALELIGDFGRYLCQH